MSLSLVQVVTFSRDRVVRDVIGDQIWVSREVFGRFEGEEEEERDWYSLIFLSIIAGLYKISLHSQKPVRIEFLLKII